MEKREWWAAALAAGIVGLLFYLLRGSLPLAHMQKQPDKTERPLLTYNDFFPHQSEKYLVSDALPNNSVLLPVRYPPRPGHELSTLVEHGFEPLYKPREDLWAWMDCPPSEEYCGVSS